MNDATRGSLWRCLLTWSTATAATAVLLGWVAPDVAAPPRTAPFDDWLTWLCALATTGCAAWGWLVTSLVVLEARSGRPRPSAAPGVPAWARRLVLAVCGAAVLAAAAPATADERPSVLEGLPLPDRAEGRSFSDLVARTIAEATPAQPAPGRHVVVRPGDSLWSIAESALRDSGASAAPAAVAAYWPRVYALNRDLVGADPDLLRPGQLLRLADLPTITTPGEDRR